MSAIGTSVATRARMRRPEQALQIQIVNALAVAAPECFVWHTPNGGKRTPTEAALFKALGVISGLPDLCVTWAVARIGFIELKADGGALTQNQEAVHRKLAGMGFSVAVARSVDEALSLLASWGAPIRGRVSA